MLNKCAQRYNVDLLGHIHKRSFVKGVFFYIINIRTYMALMNREVSLIYNASYKIHIELY
jgi:hypothetical protein